MSQEIEQEQIEKKEQERIRKGLFKLQTDRRYLLHLPGDLYELYHAALAERMKSMRIKLEIGKEESENHSKGNWHQTFSYRCSQPDTIFKDAPGPEDDPEIVIDELFDVEGSPEKVRMEPFPRESNLLTDLEQRYLSLKEAVENREDNTHLWKLAEMQQRIRLKIKEIDKLKKNLALLDEEICKHDEVYFQILEHLLREAIDFVLDLKRLGDVMKRYIRILIVDNLGDRALDQLEERGFRKRFVTIMSLNQFNRTYSEFKQQFKERYPDKEATYQDFFTKCSVFNEYEIVFYNPWRFGEEGLPVQLRLKKTPELSKKEIRKMEEDPELKAIKVKKITEKKSELEAILQKTEQEMHISETEGGVGESAYVALNKKRKRLLATIKNNNAELEELQKEISYKPKTLFYIRNFADLLKDRKISKQLSGQKVSQTKELECLSNLAKRKTAQEQVINRLNARVKSILRDMNIYSRQNPLDPEKSYQQVLGIHTLDKIEMSILGSSIAYSNKLIHKHPRPRLGSQMEMGAIDWQNEAVSYSSIYVASKLMSIDTSLLCRFFRITEDDYTERLTVSPVLPQKRDFDGNIYDLVIFNHESFSHSEITECLETRKLADYSKTPVLILDPHKSVEKNPNRLTLELMLGLTVDENGLFNFEIPPYSVTSLTKPEKLTPALCELMGIDDETVPEFEEDADSDEYQVSGAIQVDVDKTASEEDINPDFLSLSDTDQSDAVIKPPESNDQIQIFPPEEEPETIYSLGSLFSFDDENKDFVASTEDHSEGLKVNTETPGENEEERVSGLTEEFANPHPQPEKKEDQEPAKGEDDSVYDASHLF